MIEISNASLEDPFLVPEEIAIEGGGLARLDSGWCREGIALSVSITAGAARGGSEVHSSREAPTTCPRAEGSLHPVPEGGVRSYLRPQVPRARAPHLSHVYAQKRI